MALEKILIAVKTYPSLSRKYDELVCTAGFRENGEWIRIYPIPFRKLDFEQRYPKFAWIEADIIKNESDPRPESYRVADSHKIKVIGEIKSDGGSWNARRDFALKHVHTNMQSLIVAANTKNELSLATFKPTKMHGFITKEEKSKTWKPEKIAEIEARALQTDLFGGEASPFITVDKLPYKFYYHFEDSEGTHRKLMIEDWEIGMLYWNCLKKAEGNEVVACEKVKQKYWDDFTKKDLHLFLGTTRRYHGWSKNPFVIVGVFPPKHKQPSLFN